MLIYKATILLTNKSYIGKTHSIEAIHKMKTGWYKNHSKNCYDKTCKICGSLFKSFYINKIYCSKRCRDKFFNSKRKG